MNIKMQTLKTKILLSFLIILVLLGFSKALLVYYVIKNDVIDIAQKQVKHDLKIARGIYLNELNLIKTSFSLVSENISINKLKDTLNLDYVFLINANEIKNIKSKIAKKSFTDKNIIAGTRIIEKEELMKINKELFDKSKIYIKYTKNALPTTNKVLENAMALECAKPLYDTNGTIIYILYGGKILNRNHTLVDKIRNFIFENNLYHSKPVGTVTIFQNDVRISTNVLDKEGNRAIGTRVSDAVQKNVLEKGKSWVDRAFVVTDWYLTSYEPIKDIDNKVIGILYVGTLEKPFMDIRERIFLIFLFIIGVASCLAFLFSFVLAKSISKPVTDVVNATKKISGGELRYRVTTETPLQELNELGNSFNEMANKLAEREEGLRISNEKLVSLNQRYLDLIGFVTHELKGMLASIILNVYSVRDGFLGLINFKQRKAMDSVAKSLDYLSSAVKNFLNLSRIEKGELEAQKSEFYLREDIFDHSIESFLKLANEKELNISNNIEKNIKISADVDLLYIVANNLIGNAIKYGLKKGNIILSSKLLDNKVQIEIYNDARPITNEEKEKLFRRFSRIDIPSARKERGSGLGLYITREIIKAHNGKIWVEAKPNGNLFIFNIERS